MNATLAAVRTRVVDQGEPANRKDGLLITAVRRGLPIDYERHQIRAGDEWRHLPPELCRVFTAMRAERGRVIPITALFPETGGSLSRETIRATRQRLAGSRFRILTHRSIGIELVLDPPGGPIAAPSR
jgi:hypothetical protein